MIRVIICILMAIVLYGISGYLQARRKRKDFEKRQERVRRMI